MLVDDEKETKWEEWSSLTVKRVSNQQNNVLKLSNLKGVSINLKYNNLAGGAQFEKVNTRSTDFWLMIVDHQNLQWKIRSMCSLQVYVGT